MKEHYSNEFKSYKKIVCLVVMMSMLLIVGCSYSISNNKVSAHEQYQDDPTMEKTLEVVSANNVEEMYVEDTAIRLQEEMRPNGVVEIRDNLIVLPNVNLVSLSKTTAGTNWTQDSLSNVNEIYDFISLLENSEVIELEHSANPDRKMYGCDIALVFEDEAGNNIFISLKPFDDGFVGVSIQYENPDYTEEGQLIFVKSDILVETIKHMTGWNLVDFSELDTATKIILTYKSEEYQMEDDECRKMVDIIAKSHQEYVDTDCPYDVEISIYLENGTIIKGLWCNDSCGYIGIEGGMYRLSNEDSQYIVKIIERMNGLNL